MEMPGASSLCVDVELTSTAAQYTFPFCFGYQYFNGSNIKLYDVQTTVFSKIYVHTRINIILYITLKILHDAIKLMIIVAP